MNKNLVYKSTSLQVYKLSKKLENLKTQKLVNLLTLTLLLTLISCSDDKEGPVAGKSFFKTEIQKVDSKEAAALLSGFAAKIPPAVKSSYWPRNGFIPAENLAFSEGFSYDESSAGSEPKKGLGITSIPVIAEDKIFTLGGDGELEARTLGDISNILWSTKVESLTPDKKEKGKLGKYISDAKNLFASKTQFIGGNICYSLGNIYVTTKRGNLFAVSAKDGKILWSKNYNTIIRSAPLVREDKILFISSDNRATVASTKDGALIWQHQGFVGTSKVMSSPAPLLIGNKVILTYSSGEVFAMDFNSGTELWNTELSKSSYGSFTSFMNDISYNAVFHRGVIYIVSSDGTLNAIDESGHSVWNFEGEAINSSVWPVADMIFATTRFGDIIAVSAQSGKLVWKNKMAESEAIDEDELQFTGVIMANSKLYAADNNGTLYSYSPQSGDIIAKNKIPSDVALTPVIADGKMFLITKISKLIEVK